MSNPWEEISLDSYEKHMSLDSVKQLQTLNLLMKRQLQSYPVTSAMILGVAGGNGLEHISLDKYGKVYGVDINSDYLDAVKTRYKDLEGTLECVKADIINEADKLPSAQLVIADLFIEYVGYDAFTAAVLLTSAEYVSCVIQINLDSRQWVSDSPYLHEFDGLDEVHHQMDETSLIAAKTGVGYSHILSEKEPLPNGKCLVRVDFKRRS